MSPRTNERTIGAVLPKRSWVLLSLLLAAPSFAHLSPPLNENNFKRISFVGRCEQNQWSTSKDGQLEIMLSAEVGESCEARLHFREPQELKNFSSMQFWVRSSRHRQHMAVELVG